MMTSRANRVGAHSETMIFTRATHKGSLQPISMICPEVAGLSLAESVNLPARCCTLLSSAVKMAELVQQLELLWPYSAASVVTPEARQRQARAALGEPNALEISVRVAFSASLTATPPKPRNPPSRSHQRPSPKWQITRP